MEAPGKRRERKNKSCPSCFLVPTVVPGSVYEFEFGGEYQVRPGMSAPFEEWDPLYTLENKLDRVSNRVVVPSPRLPSVVPCPTQHFHQPSSVHLLARAARIKTDN